VFTFTKYNNNILQSDLCFRQEISTFFEKFFEYTFIVSVMKSQLHSATPAKAGVYGSKTGFTPEFIPHCDAGWE